MSDQKEVEQAYIANLRVALAEAIMEGGDFQKVRTIFEKDDEENVRAATAGLVNIPGVTSDRLAAGRQYIFGLLAERSNQLLMGSLANLEKKVDFLAEGIAAVDEGLRTVNDSVRKLDTSSTKLGTRALIAAAVAVFFTVIQGVAAGIQI